MVEEKNFLFIFYLLENIAMRGCGRQAQVEQTEDIDNKNKMMAIMLMVFEQSLISSSQRQARQIECVIKKKKL